MLLAAGILGFNKDVETAQALLARTRYCQRVRLATAIGAVVLVRAWLWVRVTGVAVVRLT
jgi:hypothetical protein